MRLIFTGITPQAAILLIRGSLWAHLRSRTAATSRGDIAIPSEARVKEPVLTYLASNKDKGKLKKIIAGDFSGVIIAGHDLMKIEVQLRNLGPGGAEIVATEECARLARF
jgi:hypothetical protein